MNLKFQLNYSPQILPSWCRIILIFMSNEEVLERTITFNDSPIMTEDENYIYEIKELQNKFLTLYLIKHTFSATETYDNRTIYIYKFLKNNFFTSKT